MAARDIVTVVEIDIDRCTRTFGVSPCNASLGSAVPRKCYNTFATCSFKAAYNDAPYTLRFADLGVRGGQYYPCVKSVGGYSQEVNIAGFAPDLGGLGRRAAVKIKMADFPDGDVLTDKYWQERRTGAAQIDEPGYNPEARGSFWGKFKARNPNFAGRPLRVIQGYFDSAGAVVPVKTRAYVIEEIDGPDGNGDYTITAKDILALADNKKAQAPIVTRGRLAADISATDTTVQLSPAGIGNSDYPTSGTATIGSEIVGFTRVGNTLTLLRGRLGTQAASHSVNDSVQLAYRVAGTRADSVIRDLLVNYARIPTSYIPFAEWQAEFDRWGGTMVLNATICQPTGVVELLSEISQLGVSIWWDEIGQKIRLRLNRPSEETPVNISDRNNVMAVARMDNDNQRATRVAFWAVQIDPTKALNKDNFLRGYISIDVDAESPDFYGGEITKTIYTRWLNQGNDAAAKIITGRLLNRYKRAPVTYDVTLDAKDDLRLLDVVTLESYAATDETGKAVPKLCQVYYVGEERVGQTLKVKLQSFQFEALYGNIAPNSMPNYGAATEAQKNRYAFISGPSLVFSDGRPAYQLV